MALAPSLLAADTTISNFAGTGTKGFSGDNGPATAALLNGPTGIAMGPDHALYICDTANQRIRKVARDGTITTFVGNGQPGWSGDGGPAVSASLNEPYEVRFNSQGDVFWVERLSHTVRKCAKSSGIVSTVAGTGKAGFSGDGGPASRAQLNEPHSIGFDRNDNLYICDVRNHRIRKVDAGTGIISTFSGTGKPELSPDGHKLSDAALNGPRALDFDRDGNLWLALREGNAIVRLAGDEIRRMGGIGQKGFTGDGGPAREAKLAGPKGVSIGPRGDCYFADTENHVIRAIESRAGTLRLIAGTGSRGDGIDPDPLKCQLARPHGIFVDQDGSVYIGDTDANRVRVIRHSAR